MYAGLFSATRSGTGRDKGHWPLTVGLYFSLGHSTVVFGSVLFLSVGGKTIIGPAENNFSALHHYTGLIGTTVSATFLYLIAVINLSVFVSIMRVLRRMRGGSFDDAELKN